MRAFAVAGFGREPALLDIAAPTPDRADDVLIRVSCAGVNPIDGKRLAALTPDAIYPHVLGIDIAGTVAWTPSATSGFAIGDRVFGTARRTGAYAEFSLVSAHAGGNEVLARIPDGVGFAEAASLPVAGLMALGGLHVLDLRPGERLLVLGASGGVGGIALQLARARGLHVVATTRDDGAAALRLGAAAVFDAREPDALARIASAYPDGMDAVLDLVSDAVAIRPVTELVRDGGRIVSSLHATDPALLAIRGIAATNMGADRNPKATCQGLEELARAVADGTLDPRIAVRTSLAGAADALLRLRDGRLGGKAVIDIAPGD